MSMFGSLSDEENRDFDDDDDWGLQQPDTYLPAKRFKSTNTETAALGIKSDSAGKCADLKSRHSHKRTIIQVDIDCFYAQVEMIRNPSLRNVPLGVQQKQIVVTCNYEARKHGVTKLMYVSDALSKCSNLVLVRGEDLCHYREFSSQVTSLLMERFTPLVERLGLDENFLDVSELVASRLRNVNPEKLVVAGKFYGQETQNSNPLEHNSCHCGCHARLTMGSVIAAEIRKAILEEVGLTCCAGIAHSKLLAKLVGGCHKPNMQTTLFPGNADKFLATLKARQIPGIGHTSAKKLDHFGIKSVVDLQCCPVQILQAEFGKAVANTMKALSYGIDDSDVKPSCGPKTISDEDSFPKCATLANAKERLQALIQNLLPRLTSDVGVPQTVRLSIRRHSTQSYKRESRQCSLPGKFAMADKDQRADILCGVTLGLLHKLVDVGKPFHLTLLSVCLANFQKLNSCESKAITSFFKTKSSSSITHAAEALPYTSQELSASSCEGLSLEKDALGMGKGQADSKLSDHKREIRAGQTAAKSKASGKPQDRPAPPLPKDVDPIVFAALPLEIQCELQRQWHPTSDPDLNSHNHSQSTAVQKSSGLLKYFSKA